MSSQFSQLYTILVGLGSTEHETNTTPIVFALLCDKKKNTYERMLKNIVKEVPDWKPTKFTVDFETGAISALSEQFPQAGYTDVFSISSSVLGETYRILE